MTSSQQIRGMLCALILALGGCSGLLGGGGHADLYRFGGQTSAASTEAAPASTGSAQVLFVGANFAPAIDGDRILTVTGPQAGYVADARWIAPASELFDSAAVNALEQRAPSARMVQMRGAPMPDYALGIEVRRFEADYAAGREAPPEIVIEARVRLMRWADRTLVEEWRVSSREPAAQNRLQPIVDAFDRGTATVVTQIADRTEAALARAIASPPPSRVVSR